MTAYYNEIDPYAAAWLRNLIAAGLIAPGDVDERSIEDVRPTDLAGYTQCHFFAGIGVWSYALRRAGWPDDREIWTGSCPCQPFSAAGKGAGFADERHLWPAWFHLIAQCKPAKIGGEQVAGPDADPWIDLVCDDLESLGYACGALAFPAASIGCPGIRDRLYWVADADHAGLEGRRERAGGRAAQRAAGAGRAVGWLADAHQQRRVGERLLLRPEEAGRIAAHVLEAPRGGEAGRMADAALCGRREERAHAGRLAVGNGAQGLAAGPGNGSGHCRPGPTNGFWRDADWVLCRPEPGFPDGRWRPVEPGTFPLAHGAPARVGRLRAYGNAINAVQAQIFIECALSAA